LSLLDGKNLDFMNLHEIVGVFFRPGNRHACKAKGEDRTDI
jgi:hypothetical protein